MVFYWCIFCVCTLCCEISFVLMTDLHMFFPFDSILYTAVIDVKRMIFYASWSMAIRLVMRLITWRIVIFKVLYELHKVYIDENNSILSLELRIYLGLHLNCKAICVDSQKWKQKLRYRKSINPLISFIVTNGFTAWVCIFRR